MPTDLFRRMHNLPTELSDQIYSEVFPNRNSAADEMQTQIGKVTFVTKQYTFPPLLHVDRPSGKATIRPYFTNYTFVFTSIRVFRRFFFALDDSPLIPIPNFKIILFDEPTMLDPDVILEDIFQRLTRSRLSYGWLIAACKRLIASELEWWDYQEGV